MSIIKYPEYSSFGVRFWTFNDLISKHNRSFAYRFAMEGFMFNCNGTEIKCFCCGIKTTKAFQNEKVLELHFKKSPNCLYIKNKRSNYITLFTNETDDIFLLYEKENLKKIQDFLQDSWIKFIIEMGVPIDHLTCFLKHQIVINAEIDNKCITISNLFAVYTTYTHQILKLDTNPVELNNNEYTIPFAKFILNTRERSDKDVEKYSKLIPIFKKKKKKTLTSMECSLCFVNEKTIVILPCKHLLCCSDCVKKIDECSVCKGPKVDILQIYNT